MKNNFFSKIQIFFMVKFVKQSFDISNDLVISEDRISKTTREIDRSLRTLVMNNRKKMKPPTTVEEKAIELLAQGQ